MEKFLTKSLLAVGAVCCLSGCGKKVSKTTTKEKNKTVACAASSADKPATFKQEAKSIIPHLMQVLAQKRAESASLIQQGPLMANIQASKPIVFNKTETLLRRLPISTLQLVANSTIHEDALAAYIQRYHGQLRALNFILDPRVIAGEQDNLTLTMVYQQHEASVAEADRALFRERLMKLNGELLQELSALNGTDEKASKIIATICTASEKSLERTLKKQLQQRAALV